MSTHYSCLGDGEASLTCTHNHYIKIIIFSNEKFLFFGFKKVQVGNDQEQSGITLAILIVQPLFILNGYGVVPV